MIFTDKQWDLLDVLVSIHEANGGKEFHFTRSGDDGEISYAGGISVPGIYSETDIYQLRSDGLITLDPISRNVLRGKPTESAIRRAPYMWHQRHNRITATPAIAGSPQEPPGAISDSDIKFRANAPAPKESKERSTEKCEEKCPHLGPNAAQRLSQRRAERDKLLRENIETAETQIRDRHVTLGRATGQEANEASGTAPHLEVTSQRERIIELATNAAVDGVNEFAIGLLISQKTVGAHAKWLREYAACLVADIRATFAASPVFQTAPLPLWSKDPIAQNAVHACEKILSERWKIGDGRPCDLARKSNERSLNWPPVVEEWEQFKAAAGIESGPRERIPETELRAILSRLCHANSGDLTDDQISRAGGDLCRHYGSVLIVPLDLEARELKAGPESFETSQFWKEREAEFRLHDTPRNAELSGRWASWDDKWTFHSPTGVASDCAESLALFKSLAREAAKGLRGERGADSCIYWLDLLRREKDDDTGALLFAEVTTGARATSERDYAEMLKAGKRISRPLTEFVLTDDGGVERRPYWDATNAKIENLFRKSANACLLLRSLAPHSGRRTGNPLLEIDLIDRMEAGVEALNGGLKEKATATNLGTKEAPAKSNAVVVSQERSPAALSGAPFSATIAANAPVGVPPPVKSDLKARRRGPTPDHQTAGRVAEVVARQAPDDDWRAKVDDICEALDDAEIPPPKTWLKKEPKERTWSACLDRPRAIKAIEYRLATQRKKTISETSA